MDLVDIDQVLDNLELREAADEHSKAAAAAASTATSAAVQRPPPATSFDASSSNGVVKGGSSASGSASGSSKGFVGVSQVFNSLDVYCKNVELLETAAVQQYDEECRPISGGGGAEPSQRNNYVQEDPFEAKHCHSNSATTTAAVVNSGGQSSTQSEDDDEDYDDDDDEREQEQEEEEEDEEEASNDIHKFTEAKKRRNQTTPNSNNNSKTNEKDADVDENTASVATTSDSLTTSSSSTFSSGPSLGLVSTTDEPISPITTPISPITATENEQTNFELNDANIQISVNVVLEAPVAECSAAGRAVVVEDLAAGLSSISITTANSVIEPLQSVTASSSALRNVLENLSETVETNASPQSQSQLRDDEDADDESDEQQQPLQLQNQPIEERKTNELAARTTAAKSNALVAHVDLQKVVEQLPPPPPSPLQYQQVQPITFGSTMDEISDTELDSMLQEMDIDDVADVEEQRREQEKENNKTNLSQSQSAVVELAQNSVEPPPPAAAEAVVAAAAAADDENVLQVADAMEDLSLANVATDHVNADSFSQASTVEFSEIRATQPVPTSAAAHVDDMPASSNSVASSYTSSESSLDGEDEGLPAEGDEPEEGRSASRPQRPTTLDLPTLKMSSLLATAGQTPPGAAGGGTVVTAPAAEGAASGGVDAEESNTVAEANNDGALPTDVAEASGYSDPHSQLGKIPPIWVPDNMASGCMQCHAKFTMIKRRHHCRACGKVLCSVCCSQKFKLEFVAQPEARVCVQCFLILTQRDSGGSAQTAEATAPELNDLEGGSEEGAATAAAALTNDTTTAATPRSPNPNNPMEYCSTIPPHRQVSNATAAAAPPSVIVPVGVLKKNDGSSYSSTSSNSSGKKGRKRKSVMFSDGIAPGSDLASMEHQWGEAKQARRQQGAGSGSDRSRSSGAGNKPATPTAKTSSSSSDYDATTMGLVAQLFRGSIPPSAAAAAVSMAQSTASSASSRNQSGKGDADTNKSTAAVAKSTAAARAKRLPPSGADEHGCFIPKGDNCLPPLHLSKDDSSCDYDYKEVANNYELIERLERETLKFAIQKNFFVLVKIVNLKCCMNRNVINFTTLGMHHVGNDEIIILLEYDPPASKEQMTEPPLPKDIFVHLHEIYCEAELGNPIAELSYTSPRQSQFLGSREYGGFIFIRATFQCLQDVIVPENPFLLGILIHRNEVPWAKVFPLRLMLRLGAQFRYYPCPHISMRNRDSVYADIAQTIINFLADFRNYSYTLPSIRGVYIHMEDRQTTVVIPRNRQEDVIKAINNSSDHILAFGGNFSKTADGHLVCMQNVNADDQTEMYTYSTQAINIQGQPRKVTGASFFVLNEALKSTSGLSGKCSIVEDGLMVQIMPAKMEQVRNALRNQKDIDIVCGPVDADEQHTEIVSIKWVENDRDFNIGVKSPIDEKSMEGVSSMRVHASFNYSNTNYSIRLTDIYILKFDEWYNAGQATLTATSLDITRIAEQIARSASQALVPFLDLLAASGSLKIALRATLHQENVCYEAGARGAKLPPLYMNALDNHLIPTLHNESSGIENAIVLELLFYILNV